MAITGRIIIGQSDASAPAAKLSVANFWQTAVQVDNQQNIPANGYALVWASGIWSATIAGRRIELTLEDGNGNMISPGVMRDIAQTANRNQPWSMLASIPRNLNIPGPPRTRPLVKFRNLDGTGTVRISNMQITCVVVSASSTINGADGGMGLLWSEAPTFNGLIQLIGWNIQTDAAAALTSAAPITASDPFFHSHLVIDVSAAAGIPFTIRLTGTSVNESTGVLTPADTEDLSITANGFYQSSKSWITAPGLSILEAAKSCTLDIFRMTYWDRGNLNFTVNGARMEWEPDAPAWSVNFKVLKVNNNGSITTIDDVTFANTDVPPRADNSESGKYKRGDYNTLMNGALKEGVIVEVTQTSIRNLLVELKYAE